jgi:hypothetical protein
MLGGIEKANDVAEGVAQDWADVPNDRRKGAVTDDRVTSNTNV